MRSAPVRTCALAIALCCIGRFAAGQTPAAPPPAAEVPPPAPPADVPPPPALPPAEVPPTPLPPAAEVPPPPPVVAAPAPTPPPAAPPPGGPLLTKYIGGTIYGFVEADGIWDSTQSLADLGGNGAIQRQGSFGAEHGRTQFSARNSRLGFKLKGPDSDMIKTSAMIEGDFLGNQPQSAPTPAAASPAPSVTENNFFASPTFRIRHFNFKVETPYIDMLAGQYWQLFGWQSMFHPNTVQMQGVPGQVYSRAPQFRVGKAYKTPDMTFEWALAASRPASRDSEWPDGQAGIRFALNNFKALHTGGATGTALDGASIGLSTVGRRFRVPTYMASPSTGTLSINGYGYSADLLLPVVPATNMKDGNALTITASYVYGQATADYYTGLTGGATVPALPSGSYAQDFDNGLLSFTPDGVLHAIRWSSYIVGAQYYLPGNMFWITGNFSHMHSPDMKNLEWPTAMPTNTKAMFDTSYWADGLLFYQMNQAVRFGVEYAYYWQKYLDGVKGTNSRVQFSAFYVF